MKLALIHSVTENYQPLVNVCYPNHQDYAANHNYDCLLKIDNERPLFGRFYYAIDMLKQYDAVAIIDIDLLFSNKQIKLEDKLGNYDLVTGRDVNGLNCSIVIIRNSEWSFKFWENYFSHIWDVSCAEQTTLAYNLCVADKAKWSVVNQQRELFSILGQHYDRYDINEEYQEGDFCLTLPGLSLEKRIEILSDYKNKLLC